MKEPVATASAALQLAGDSAEKALGLNNGPAKRKSDLKTVAAT
ncbi:hypothetical protein [Pseudomonas sp. RIT-PI-S]|nr:hypothetical protein [Pseudomonas sp. RIT-PI-S]